MKKMFAAFFLALLTGAAVAAEQVTRAERVFSGKLGEKYRIQMRLRREGGTLSGTYFYERVGRRLSLRGEIDGRGNFVLREYNAAGAQTGLFKGQWMPSDCEGCGDLLTGNWSKPDGSREMPFSLTVYAVAFRGPLKLVTRSFAEENRKEQPAYEISAEYPQLVGAVGARFNELIRGEVTKAAAPYREDFLDGGGEFNLTFDVGIATDDLVSVDLIQYYHYDGAGHRGALSGTINYDLKRGRVIKFEELFLPGSDYEKLLGDYCLRDLRAQFEDAELMTDAMLKGHVENVVGDEHKWMITPDGLDIIFDSEEMGAGKNQVIVPYAVLKRVIRPGGPLAAFAR